MQKRMLMFFQKVHIKGKIHNLKMQVHIHRNEPIPVCQKYRYPVPVKIWLYSLSVLRSQDSELCADFCQKRNRGHHYGEGVKPDSGRLHFSDHLQVLVGLLCVVIDVDRDHTLMFPWFFCRKQTKILSSMTDKCIG